MSAAPPPVTYNVAELLDVDFFGYEPSLALASIALSLYLLGALVCGIQTYLARNPHTRHMHLVTLTGLTEAGGYIALVWLIHNSGKSNIYGGYVAMQVLTVLSPNLLQAANYSTVGKVTQLSGLSKVKRFLRPFVVSSAFIAIDVLALVVQAVGITIWASSKGSGEPKQSEISLGSWITVGGLAIQLVSFILFTVLAVWVQIHPGNCLRSTRGHKKLFTGIYLTITFITVRNIFRFVEFIQGAVLPFPAAPGTYVISEQEALFYTLDTLPILLCFLFYALFHPAWLLPKHGMHHADDGAGTRTSTGTDDTASEATVDASVSSHMKEPTVMAEVNDQVDATLLV